METKICSKCGKELPLNEEYFIQIKANIDGFSGQCKICRAKHKREWAKENREKIISSKREWAARNKDKIAANTKKHREMHKEEIVEEKKKYYESNKEKIILRSRVNYETNKEKSAEQRKRYRQSHLKEHNISKQKREARKRNLPSTLTPQQWESIKLHFDNRCAYCGRELPLAQEHFVALSKGGEFSFNNIVPSCTSCNSSKHNKDFFEWYPKYKYYSKKREKFILEFLGYKDKTQQLKLI